MPAVAPTKRSIAQIDDDGPRKPNRQMPKLLCIDLVEDRMRTRFVAVFIAFAMYLVVGSELIRSNPLEEYETAASTIMASQLPASAELGPHFSDRPTSVSVISSTGTAFVYRKCPALGADLCDVNASYTENVSVSASVVDLTYEVEPPAHALNCKTSRRKLQAGTLEDLMLEAACQPELNSTSNITDDTGTATFTGLAVLSGPPATYTFAFSAGDGTEVKATTRLSSKVASLDVRNSGAGVVAALGAVISPQPIVKVLDGNGEPLANRMVVAYASSQANIYRASDVLPSAFPGTDFSEEGKDSAYQRGQKYALLENVKAWTDAEGVATFANLTITATSSRFAYINFYCEGVQGSWSDPKLQPPVTGGLLKPRSTVVPTIVTTAVTSVVQIADGSPPPSPPPANASSSGEPAAAGGRRLAEAEARIVCPATPQRVVEGAALDFVPRVRVGKTVDGQWQGVAGVKVVAVMATAAGWDLPQLYEYDTAALEARGVGMAMPTNKKLLNAVSTESGADGVVRFEGLAFSSTGVADSDLASDPNRPSTYHRIAFCTPASTRGGDYLSGCTLSCPYFVATRVQTIEWSSFPTIIRAKRTSRHSIGAGESVFAKQRGGDATTPLEELPPTPVIRLLDNAGQGVPGKGVFPLLYVKRFARQQCGDAGVTLDDAQLERPFEHPCAMNAIWTFYAVMGSLEVRKGDGVKTQTGSQGFLALPLVYTLLSRALWLDVGGASDLRDGDVRILILSADESVASELSPPITFSQPADRGMGDTCAKLVPADQQSWTALLNPSVHPMRQSNILGGLNYEKAVAGQNAKLYGVDTGYASYESWMLNPMMAVSDADTVTSASCCNPAACLTQLTCDPSSCAAGASGRDCRGAKAMQALRSGDKPFQGIRIRALDEDGNGVPNMRIRLRSLMGTLLPQIPNPTEIISCGIMTEAEVDSWTANLGASVAQSIYAGNAAMDNVRLSEAAFACVTDSLGYVDMQVKYVSRPGLINFFEKYVNVNVSATPEYVRHSVSGSIIFEYEAMTLAGATVSSECRSDLFSVKVESRANTVVWDSGVAGDSGATRTAKGYSEVLPDDVAVMGAAVSPAASTVPLAASLAAFNTLNWRSDPAAVASVESSFQQLLFTVYDSAGKPVQGVQGTLKMIGLPYYLPGLWTSLKPGCLTTSRYSDIYLANNPALNYMTSCSTFQLETSVEELGLNNMIISDVTGPWASFPWAPYATVLVKRTQASGQGWIAPLIHQGHPGLYTVAVQADGVRSKPVYVPIHSSLAKMTISQEPSMQPAWADANNVDVGVAASGGGWQWAVGQELATPLRVSLLNGAGTALRHYQPMLVAVDPNTGAYLAESVIFDMPAEKPSVLTSRGIGAIGFARGSPADNNGVSTFTVMLLDGLPGTCFKLMAYFKAFSPDDVAILAGEGVTGYDDAAVTVTSKTRFCVTNGVKADIVTQPSSGVALGVALPDAGTPVVRLSVPMVPLVTRGANPKTFYQVPYGTILAQVQMLPNSIGGDKVARPSDRRRLGASLLSANRCAMYKGFTIVGSCAWLAGTAAGARLREVDGSKTYPLLDERYLNNPASIGGAAGGAVAGGTPVADLDAVGLNASMGHAYTATSSNAAPMWVQYVKMTGLSWNARTAAGNTMRLGASTALHLDGGPASVSSVMEVETDPKAVTLLTVPPTTVRVGEPFLLKAKVTIANGSPLRGARVLVTLASPTGPISSPLDFLAKVVGPSTINGDNAPPTIAPDSAEAFTDSDGLARFVLEFSEGPPASLTSLVLETGNVKSTRTEPISVINDVTSVNATNVTYERTGVNGIGDPNTAAVRLQGEKPQSFPVNLSLPGEITVKVDLDADTSETPSGTAEALLANASWLRRKLAFRVFTQSDIDQLWAQKRSIEAFRARIANETEALVDAIDAAAEQQGRRLAATVDSLRDTALLAGGDVKLMNASQYQDVQKRTAEALLFALGPDAAKKVARASPAALEEFAKLLMGGTMPSATKPNGPGSNDAFVLPLEPRQVELAEYVGTEATLIVRNVTLIVRKPGKFYLQPNVAGIVGEIGGEIKVEKYSKRTAEAVAIEWGLRILFLFLIGMMAIGNSDWHRPAIGVPLAAGVLVGTIIYSYETYMRGNDDAGSPYSIGLWWMICFGMIILGTICGLVGELTPLGKVRAFRPFPVYRRQMYEAYVRSLVNKGHETEIAKLKRSLQTRSEDRALARAAAADSGDGNGNANGNGGGGAGGAEEAAEEDNATFVAETLYLEKRIQVLIHKERSTKVQLKALFKGIFTDDPEAFFVPVRMYAAFFLSFFATVFMATWFIRTFIDLRATVRKADINTLVAIYRALGILQLQFLKLTGADLPYAAGHWLEQNALRVHQYMISLADALEIGAITGCVIGMFFYVGALLVLVGDFRAQIIQARRGIWQFNEPKVALKLSVVFIGTQISNGVFVFVVTGLLFAFLATILAWSLTWQVIEYVLTNNLALILSIVGFALINPIIKKIAARLCFSKKFIKWRYGWAAFELYALMAQVAAGLVKSIVRFVMVIIAAFWSLPRIDRSPFPAWVEYYLLLDAGSKSYQGVIVNYHLHNNPVMRVFAWMVEELSLARRLPGKRAELGLCTPRYRRVANRWQKALILLQNPPLREFISHHGLSRKERTAINKMAKKGEFSVKRLLEMAQFKAAAADKKKDDDYYDDDDDDDGEGSERGAAATPASGQVGSTTLGRRSPPPTGGNAPCIAGRRMPSFLRKKRGLKKKEPPQGQQLSTVPPSPQMSPQAFPQPAMQWPALAADENWSDPAHLGTLLDKEVLILRSPDGETFLKRECGHYSGDFASISDMLFAAPQTQRRRERLYARAPLSDGLRREVDLEYLEELVGGAAGAHQFVEAKCGVWLGSAGCVTPLHYDLCHGFLAGVIGTKHFTYYAPEDFRRLYPRPEQSELSKALKMDLDYAAHLSACMAAWNTGQEAGGGPEQKLAAERHRQQAESTAWHAIVHPGDILYTPPYWWHHVVTSQAESALSVLIPFDPTKEEPVHAEHVR